jgi:hypothetical protein
MCRANEGLELRRAMRHLQTREPAFDGAGTIHLNCPRCGLTITPKASWLTIEHCPRCIARNRVAVSLFASTLPTDELYAATAGLVSCSKGATPPPGGLVPIWLDARGFSPSSFARSPQRDGKA